MSNALLLFFFLSIAIIAVLVGRPYPTRHEPIKPQQVVSVPHIGSIEVLNGCGIEGAANKMADFLRSKQFDVKNISNATSWNYPFTMVISRTKDMFIAEKIANLLDTKNVVLIRTNEEHYDVTVVLGPDFGKMIQ